MKPQSPPPSVGRLTKYVLAYAREAGIPVGRVRQAISFMVLAGALRRVVEGEASMPKFAVKGGVALELRLREKARATTDLDLVLDHAEGDLVVLLQEALADPYESFEFRVKNDPFEMPNRALRLEVVLTYRRGDWGTVQVDLSHSEGVTEVDLVPALPILADFGISGPEEVECLSLRYHLAQKFHGMTQPRGGRGPNPRFRDMIDILLMIELVDDLYSLRTACEEVFAGRGTHPWPPDIDPPNEWEVPFAVMAASVDLPERTLREGTDQLRQFLATVLSTA